MSEGKKIADLFAKVGFKISSEDYEKVKSFLNGLNDALKEAISNASEFANQLTRISKVSGLSPRLVQQMQQFALEAGVSANEMESIIAKTADIANKAFFGLGNEYAQWGLYFDRTETSATALQKILTKINSLSEYDPKRRELLNTLGLELDVMTLLADKYKEIGGFRSKDLASVIVSNEDVAKMQKVNIELKKTQAYLDQVDIKLISRQSDSVLWYVQKVKNLQKWFFDSVLELFDTKFGKTAFGGFIKTFPALMYALNNFEGVFNKLAKTFQFFKKIGLASLWGVLISGASVLIAKILKLTGLIKYDLAKSLQNAFNKILDSTGTFGKGIKKLISDGLLIIENFLTDLLPDWIIKGRGFQDFFSTAKSDDGGIFLALSGLIDNVLSMLWDIIKVIWKATKEVAFSLSVIIGTYIDDFISKLMMNIKLTWLDIWQWILEKIPLATPMSPEEYEQQRQAIINNTESPINEGVRNYMWNNIGNAIRDFGEDVKDAIGYTDNGSPVFESLANIPLDNNSSNTVANLSRTKVELNVNGVQDPTKVSDLVVKKLEDLGAIKTTKNVSWGEEFTVGQGDDISRILSINQGGFAGAR